MIHGGVWLKQVADSNLLLYNRFDGLSGFGIKIDASSGGATSAGQCQFVGNSMVAAGGLVIEAGTLITVGYNYFEEVSTPQYARNAFIDLRGLSNGVVGTQIIGNVIANIVSTGSLAILIGTNGAGTVPDSTYIDKNFIANLNARTAVNNFGTGTIVGMNTWQTSATHIGGTGTLKNAIGSVVADAP
jgi:hypothetical protein